MRGLLSKIGDRAPGLQKQSCGDIHDIRRTWCWYATRNATRGSASHVPVDGVLPCESFYSSPMPRTRPRADTDLIAAVTAGNLGAFEEVVERYQQVVCAVAFSACGNRALSEDVAQETFVSAWKNIGMLQDHAKLKGWLCSIARNRARDALRKRHREVLTNEGDGESHEFATTEDDAPSPLDNTVSIEQEQRLWHALQGVPDKFREPLVLFYRDGQSVNQVAEDLGLSVAAVKQRLSRGRAALKDSLSQVSACLARTRPSKAFTVAVIATIAAQGGVAQAAASEILSQGGTAKGVGKGAALSNSLVALAGFIVLIASAGLSWMLYESSRDSQAMPSAAVAESTRAQSATTIANHHGLQPHSVEFGVQASLRVDGLVRDLFGQPVANASVVMTGDPTRFASSDEYGNFRFTDVEPGSYRLQARTDSGGSHTRSIHLHDHASQIVLELVPGTSLELSLIDGVGGPALPGVAVSLTSGVLDLDGTTDADGIARFDGLTTSSVVANIAHEGYASNELRISLSGEQSTNKRRLALVRGVRLHGSIHDSHGQPVEGALIRIDGEFSSAHAEETTSDQHGRWHFDTVAKESNMLVATHDDYAWVTRPVPLRSATGDVELQLVMPQGKSASGVVVHSDGSPAVNAQVISHPSGKVITTDDKGRFTLLGLEHDETSVRAEHQVSGSESVQLLEGNGSTESLALVLEDQSLRGRVVDASGAPIAGALVRAAQVGAETLDEGGAIHLAEDVSTSNGTFTLGPLPDDAKFEVVAIMPTVAPSYLELEPLSPRLAVSGEGGIALVLDKPGQLVGSVQGPGGPIDEFAVTIGNFSEALNTEVSTPFSETEASFALSRVPAGTYSVGVVAKGFDPLVLTDVHVRAGAATDLGALQLRPSDTLRGKVVDSSGQPVAFARVVTGSGISADAERFVLFSPSVDQGADPLAVSDAAETEVLSDAQGNFAITRNHSERRRLYVAAEAPGLGRSTPRLVARTSANPVTLRLRETGGIVGEVPTLGEHTLVTAIPNNGKRTNDAVLYVTVDAIDGAFQMQSLAPGRYLVSAHPANSAPRFDEAIAVEVRAGRTSPTVLESITEAIPSWTPEALHLYEEHVEQACACKDNQCRSIERATLMELNEAYDLMSVAAYERRTKLDERLDLCAPE